MHGFLSKVISEILQTCIKAFLHVFEEKNIFGNISPLGLGRNIIIGHDDDDCDIDRYTHIFGKLSIHTYWLLLLHCSRTVDLLSSTCCMTAWYPAVLYVWQLTHRCFWVKNYARLNCGCLFCFGMCHLSNALVVAVARTYKLATLCPYPLPFGFACSRFYLIGCSATGCISINKTNHHHRSGCSCVFLLLLNLLSITNDVLL